MALLRVGPSPDSLTDVNPDPSSMTWGLQDISGSDSGRVLDGDNTMYKMRTSQKVKLNLQWSGLSAERASALLRQFNAEYFYVEYFDALLGARTVKQFYSGDRTAPMRWYSLSDGTLWSTVSFNIIER